MPLLLNTFTTNWKIHHSEPLISMLCSVQELFCVCLVQIQHVLSYSAHKLCLPMPQTAWLTVANMAVARHEQLLLWLNQSPATYLSANVNVRVCACEWVREYMCAQREKNDMHCLICGILPNVLCTITQFYYCTGQNYHSSYLQPIYSVGAVLLYRKVYTRTHTSS